jgi:predicted amidohydrolase
MVGVAQWLAMPGAASQNLEAACDMMERAAHRGVELLVLPELWACGYDPATLPEDARSAAEPIDGPRGKRLSKEACRHGMWLAAGSVPERGSDGNLYNTALVYDPSGKLVATHRKAHLYPPTSEPAVFTPGACLTTFTDASLGGVGVAICFDGDFPEVARTMAMRGARLVLAPSAYEVEGATAWDLLYPALALTNSQWWIQANQAGSHHSSTLLGASRIVAPTGTIVAEASRTVPGCTAPAELLVHRIDLHLAYQQEGLSALLDTQRRSDLYFEQAGPG